MATLYNELDDRLCRFINDQKVFFVGSAPLDEQGAVNISPKGMDSLRILDSKTIAYLDYTGSGVESIAHIKENGRFVMMFCSFDASPLILRLHGKATVIERSDPEWIDLENDFPKTRMARAIIKLCIARIADSCGWGVPMYEYIGERVQYPKYAQQIDDEQLRDAQLEWNMKSIDGLPGLRQPSL